TVKNLRKISKELYKLSYYLGKAHATCPGSMLQFSALENGQQVDLLLSKRMLDSSVALFNQTLGSLSQFLELCISKRRTTGEKRLSPNERLPIYLGDNLYNFFTKNKKKFGYIEPQNDKSGLLIDNLKFMLNNRIML